MEYGLFKSGRCFMLRRYIRLYPKQIYFSRGKE